jgi:hypothetical protein
MDLRKLSERVQRWVNVGSDTDAWLELRADFLDSVEKGLRLLVGDPDGEPLDEPFRQFEHDLEWNMEGCALFDELAKLTESPARVKAVRDAMTAFGCYVSPRFCLPSAPAPGGTTTAPRPALVVVRGGAPERPSGRYIDSAKPDPEAS